jgi:group I intron endonuclease
MIGIYYFKNIENGKVYVGSSMNTDKRRKDHLYLLSKGIHSNPHLQMAFNKYGVKGFEFVVLERTHILALIAREQYWIDYFDATNREKGYNVCPRADRTTMSEESKIRHSITNKRLGIKPPSQRGRPVSQETRLKRSNSLKRVGHRPPSNKGKKHTEETKRKMSITAYKRFGKEEGCRTKIKDTTGI